MLKEFYVKKLFGRFDYPFSFKEGGVTILTGPNGFGKTTILNIINAISNSDLKFFFQLDFEEIELRFDNKNSTKITKLNQKLNIDGIDIPIPTDKEFKYLSSRFNNYPYIVDNEIINYHMSESFFYDNDDYITRININNNRNNDSVYLRLVNSKKDREKLASKLNSIQKQCGKVRMISEQRLLDKKNDKDSPTIIDVITQLPNKLKSEISKVTEEYSKVANNLDSSYPKRLLTANAGLSDISEYELRLIEANSRFKKLSEYNLVDITLIDYKNYDDRYSTALMIYFDDFTLKYKVFEELIDKLDLFTRIINNRLLFKNIKVSAESGFCIVDSDNSEKILDLSKLSSGEKQEIVLFYDLIFNVESELLLLIDEPEISLHITWQRKFLEDLLEVTKRSKLEVVVATHSPQIINNNWDLQIDLGELYGE